jgi:hypothetical protein
MVSVRITCLWYGKLHLLAAWAEVEQAVWGLAVLLSGTTVSRCRATIVAAADLVTIRGTTQLGSSSLTAVESGSSMGSMGSMGSMASLEASERVTSPQLLWHSKNPGSALNTPMSSNKGYHQRGGNNFRDAHLVKSLPTVIVRSNIDVEGDSERVCRQCQLIIRRYG